MPGAQTADNINVISSKLNTTARLVEDGAPVSNMVHIYIIMYTFAHNSIVP